MQTNHQRTCPRGSALTAITQMTAMRLPVSDGVRSQSRQGRGWASAPQAPSGSRLCWVNFGRQCDGRVTAGHCRPKGTSVRRAKPGRPLLRGKDAVYFGLCFLGLRGTGPRAGTWMPPAWRRNIRNNPAPDNTEEMHGVGPALREVRAAVGSAGARGTRGHTGAFPDPGWRG